MITRSMTMAGEDCMELEDLLFNSYLNGISITTIHRRALYIWKSYELNVDCSKIKIHLRRVAGRKKSYNYKNLYYTVKYSPRLKAICVRNSIKEVEYN